MDLQRNGMFPKAGTTVAVGKTRALACTLVWQMRTKSTMDPRTAQLLDSSPSFLSGEPVPRDRVRHSAIVSTSAGIEPLRKGAIDARAA
jgi:hypothetical protein